MNLFTPNKPQNKNDQQKKIQFIRNVYSALSHDPSMCEELKQRILIGTLSFIKLTPDEVQENIANQYFNATP